MRVFSAHETKRLLELDGVELADFRQRAIAFVVDVVLAVALLLVVLLGAGWVIWLVRASQGDTSHYSIKVGETEWERTIIELVDPIVYFGLLTYWGDGRTPGKRLTGIRVVSLVHRHMTLWHSIERALGYGAAALEFGFGFLQFFIHPYRRTVQDRIAETIVVKEPSLRASMAEWPSQA